MVQDPEACRSTAPRKGWREAHPDCDRAAFTWNLLRLGMVQSAILDVEIEINLDAYRKLHFCMAQDLNLLHIR